MQSVALITLLLAAVAQDEDLERAPGVNCASDCSDEWEKLANRAIQARSRSARGNLDKTTIGKGEGPMQALGACCGDVRISGARRLAPMSRQWARTLESCRARALRLATLARARTQQEAVPAAPDASAGRWQAALPGPLRVALTGSSRAALTVGTHAMIENFGDWAEPFDSEGCTSTESFDWEEDFNLYSPIDDNASKRYFDDIELIESLGAFCWDPEGLVPKGFRNITSDDILHGLRQRDTPPDQLIPLRRLEFPAIFFNPEPQLVSHTFPVDSGYLVPLYVAKERGLDLTTVDFVLGGSALNALASRTIEREGSGTHDGLKYLVQKCPTTNVIVLAKSRVYTANHAEISAQYKRLVTGRPLVGELDLRNFETLQLLKVGDLKVLVATEVEAVDAFGRPVKLRSGRPRATWNTMKVMFQMFSSGSRMLLLGDRRGPILNDIFAVSLDQLVEEQSPAALATAGSNIVEALKEIKRSSQIGWDAPMEIDFKHGALTLLPCPDGDLLPSADVVKELFSETSLRRQAAAAEAASRVAASESGATALEKSPIGLSIDLLAETFPGVVNLSPDWNLHLRSIPAAPLFGIFAGSGFFLAASRFRFGPPGKQRPFLAV